jgi:general stress protein YciG
MAGNQGFASMDSNKARKIQSMGGQASGSSSTSPRASTSARGAAGKTPAAKRGGQNSHRSS